MTRGRLYPQPSLQAHLLQKPLSPEGPATCSALCRDTEDKQRPQGEDGGASRTPEPREAALQASLREVGGRGKYLTRTAFGIFM